MPTVEETPIPIIVLRDRREVLGRRQNVGHALPITYANLTQARRRADALGEDWTVTGMRPYYVTRVPRIAIGRWPSGGVYTFTPLNTTAERLLRRLAPDASWQAGALLCEQRYEVDLARGCEKRGAVLLGGTGSAEPGRRLSATSGALCIVEASS